LAAAQVRDLRNDPVIDVLPQTRADFDAALALYEAFGSWNFFLPPGWDLALLVRASCSSANLTSFSPS
jgi:hypothetical protein